jgi:transcriptional regulator with XRE-family HTH domain
MNSCFGNMSQLLLAVGTLPDMGTETHTTTRDRTEFGQRLRMARKHAKLTQAELGERSGLGQSAIAYLEAKGNASEQTWKIAQVCGVRAAWLARNEGPMLGPESALDAALSLVSEPPAEYLAPNSARDYRATVYSLAAMLEGTVLQNMSIKEFLQLADKLHKHYGGS